MEKKAKCDPPLLIVCLILPATVPERIVFFMPEVGSNLHCMISHPNNREQASPNILKGGS